jgi:hypothetical protein
MPVEVVLNEVPAGVVIKACRGGESASVRVTGFVSSEDGQELITHLEQFPSTLLAKAVGDRVSPSQVDNLLAIVRRDKTATVYVNELRPTLTTKIAVAKEKGDPVFKDDIVDITNVDLGVNVPDDAAVVFVFSWGWRKGVFYDFSPLRPDAAHRAFDLPATLGALYTRLMFQERFPISNDDWANLFKEGWFPFVGLRGETVKLLLTHLRAGWGLDDLTPRVVDEVGSKARSFFEVWKSHPALAEYAPILGEAVGLFQSGDHAGCSQLLHPRIAEAVRAALPPSGAPDQGGQEDLGEHDASPDAVRAESLLMPHRFEAYLREVYLPTFNPEGPAESAVPWPAPKSAAVGLLVVHQLFHSLGPANRGLQTETRLTNGDGGPTGARIEPIEAANRWHQWSVKGPNAVLDRLIERLDGNLPNGWKRLRGEELKPHESLVRPGSAWYSLSGTPEHVGVVLSVERSRGGLRGGRVSFEGPPHPASATVPTAWARIMVFLDEGIVPAARSARAMISAPDPGFLFLAELPPAIAEALGAFSRSERKSLPLSPEDTRRWNTFVIDAFRARTVIDGRSFVEWLVHECWERGVATELEARFFDQCQLLARYAEEVSLV